MSSGHSLEAERQAILDRMQMRRENYRRMLTHGDDLDEAVGTEEAGAAQYAIPPSEGYTPAHQQVHHQTHHQAHRAAPTQFPRSMLMRTITEHPYLCALGVAAVVLIGPKRIARTALGAGSTVSALAAGNQSQGDMVGKLLALAGAYVQGRSNDNR